MHATSDDAKNPQIKDRIVYWPTVLAIVWFLLAMDGSSDSGEGQMVPGLFLTLVCPVMSAFIAVLLCVGWAYQRAWRRLLSTMILPLSVVLMICLIGS